MNPVSINGLSIYPFNSKSQLLDYVENKKVILLAVNAEKILKANPKFNLLVNNNIGYPDGIGAVWALKKKGIDYSNKIPGCELWLDIIKRFYLNRSFYLIGGKQFVIDETVARLRHEFPGIKILNYRNGYFIDDKEISNLKSDIASKKPDIVFVAMGSPKQEFLMQELLNIHPALYQGLGGSFDVFIGNSNRAPKWWIEHNLEWAYRLIKEPKRIGRQLFLIKFFIQLNFNKF